MRRAEIVTVLARRYVPPTADAPSRAAMWKEVERAVRAAGRHAEPALILTETCGDRDALVAFVEQVRALAAPSRDAGEEPEDQQPWTRGRSSWSGGDR